MKQKSASKMNSVRELKIVQTAKINDADGQSAMHTKMDMPKKGLLTIINLDLTLSAMEESYKNDSAV